jgi:predicted N-acetyltransferase YhbS
MRDGVGEKPRRIARKSEIVVTGKTARDTLKIIDPLNLGRHFISHMHTLDVDPKSIRDDYKANGYRVLLSEEFFVHDSNSLPTTESGIAVHRVTTMAQSDAIKSERRNKKAIRDVDLCATTTKHRLYAVIEGGRARGWVGSVPFGKASWIADLYVLPEYRGQGLGSALMAEVTRDDKLHGVASSVLLASAAGARLYPHVGYRHIGTLQLFCPTRTAGG